MKKCTLILLLAALGTLPVAAQKYHNGHRVKSTVAYGEPIGDPHQHESFQKEVPVAIRERTITYNEPLGDPHAAQTTPVTTKVSGAPLGDPHLYEAAQDTTICPACQTSANVKKSCKNKSALHKKLERAVQQAAQKNKQVPNVQPSITPVSAPTVQPAQTSAYTTDTSALNGQVSAKAPKTAKRKNRRAAKNKKTWLVAPYNHGETWARKVGI